MMTKQRWMIVAYTTIGLAILGAVGMLLWFGQKTVAGVLLLLGFGGGKKALKNFVKADTDKQQRDSLIEQEAQDDADRIAWEEKADAAAAAAKEEQQLQDIQARSDKEQAEAAAQIAAAQTKEQLDKGEDQQLAELEAMLPARKSEGGFVRAALFLFLIVVALVLFTLAGSPAHAKGTPATAADKARALKRSKIIIRAKKELRRLNTKITALKVQHAIKMGAAEKRHAAELRKEKRLHASTQKACTAKIDALNMRRCPPTWPGALLSGGAVLLACGIGIGVREFTR